MTLVLTRPTEFQKPTHLHSHLLFCNRTDQRKKSKRECKPTHLFTADRPCKHDRQHFGRTEGQLITFSRIDESPPAS